VTSDAGTRTVRLGTRGSALALAQATLARHALDAQGVACELVEIVTHGDVRAPDTAWGEGAFVGAIEAALLDGRVDVAVHSAKDMPTDEDYRLQVAAYLERADPLDALVTRADTPWASLADLPDGAVIGTDSPRRAGFLRARRPDIQVRPLHGNVDTRLRRLDAGEADALVLAVAGLTRLNREERIDERFAADALPPAPGQGAIALQVRADDDQLIGLLAAVDDRPTRLAVEVERAFLAATGGGCRAPVGALASVAGDEVEILAGYATLDGGSVAIERSRSNTREALTSARELATRLVTRRAVAAERGRVLVTRPGEQAMGLLSRLAEHGLRGLLVPAIEIRPVPDLRPLELELRHLAGYSWVVLTSANGARVALDAARRIGIDPASGRWAAVGRSTAEVLLEAGAAIAWRPSSANARSLADELPIGERTSVLLVRGALGDDELPRRLEERQAEVRSVIAYQTVEAPETSRPLLEAAFAEGPPQAVLFASPSAVRGLLALGGEDLADDLRRLPAVCVGPTTATAAREHGFSDVCQASDQDASALADLAAEIVNRSMPAHQA
jgi:hydroxymethylbilane synthase